MKAGSAQSTIERNAGIEMLQEKCGQILNFHVGVDQHTKKILSMQINSFGKF